MSIRPASLYSVWNRLAQRISILFIFLYCNVALGQVAGDLRSAVAAGNWNVSTSWQRYSGTIWENSGVGANNPGQVPSATTNVYIQAGHTITLTAAAACNNFNISNNTTGTRLALGTNTLSVSGVLRNVSSAVNVFPATFNATLSGTAAWITSTTGKISIVGTTRTLTAATEWGAGNAGSTDASGNGFDLEINLTAGNTVTCNTSIKARDITVTTGTLVMATTGTDLLIDQGTAGVGTCTVASAATLNMSSNGDIQRTTGSSATSNFGTFNLQAGGNLIFSSVTAANNLTATAITSNGTVQYSAAGNQTFVSRDAGNASAAIVSTYTNLTISGSGVKTMSSAITVNGNLAVNAGTLADGAFQITGNATGTLTVAAAATLQLGAGNATITSFPTNFTAINTTLNATSTVNYNTTTNPQTVSSTPTYGHLTITGINGTKTLNGNTVVAGNFTITGANTFSFSTFTLSIAGTYSNGGTITANGAGARLIFNGTTSITFTIGLYTGSVLSGLDVNKTGGGIVTLGSALTLGTGLLSVTSGTLRDGGFQITGNAAGTLSVANGATLQIGAGAATVETFPSLYPAANITLVSGSTVIYNSTSTMPVSNVPTYHHLSSNGTGVKSVSGGGTQLTINGNLAINAGTLQTGLAAGISYPIIGNATGTLTVAAAAGLTIGTGTATATAFPANFTAGNITLNATSTVTYNSTGAQTVSSTPSLYGNLTITGVSIKTTDGAINIAGALTINSGTFADAGFIITARGNIINNGTHSGTGKILLSTGTALHTLTGTPAVYGNLELNDIQGANLSSTGTTTVSGTLTATAGTFTLAAFTTSLSVNGATSIASGASLIPSSPTGAKTFTGDVTNLGTWNNTGNSAITFAGNLSSNGTFTAGTGLYTLSGVGKTINTTNSSALSIPSVTVSGTYSVSANYLAGNQFSVPTALTVSLATSSLSNNGTMTAPSVTISLAGGQFINNNTLTTTTTLTGAGTYTNAANSSLFFGGGTVGVTTFTVNANPNTVTYNSTTAAQTVRGGAGITYHHLTISKTGQVGTLGGIITINGNLLVSGGTFSDGAFQITGNGTGTLTVNAGCTLQIGAGTATITTFPTLFTTANIALNATSTVNYNTITNTQVVAANIAGTGPSTYGNLTATGASGTKQVAGPITVTTSLSIATAGETFADNGNAVRVLGSLSSNGTHTSTGSGKIWMNGTSAQTISFVSGTGTRLFGNIDVDNTAGVTLAGVAANIYQVNGTYTPTLGALSIASTTLTLAGTVAATGTGTFSGTTASGLTIAGASGGPLGTLNFTTGAQNVGQFNMSRTGANGSVTLGTPLTINTNLNFTAASTGLILIGNNNLIFASAATATLTNASASAMIVADAASGTGQVMKIFGTGNPAAFTIPVGDNTGTIEYSPVAITLTTVTAATQTIGVKVTDAAHPNNASPSLPADFVSRFWTFTNAGGGTYNHNDVFTFPAGDVTGTATNMLGNRWDTGNSLWQPLPGSSTATTTTINAVASATAALAGDYQPRTAPPQIYTWIGTSGTGDNGTWTTATHWSPSRVYPAATDILQFTLGGSPAVSGVTTQTIRQLLVNGNTNPTFAAAAGQTLSISGPAATNNLDIASGSNLTLNATATFTLNFTGLATQLGNIAGTLTINTGNVFTTTALTTAPGVNVTGAITNNAGGAGAINGSTASLTFAAGSFYNHPSNTAASNIPTATWNATSTCNITSSTIAPTTGYTQTFGHFTVATGAAVTSATNGAMVVNGNLNVNSGILATTTQNITANGPTTIAAGAQLIHTTGGTKTFADITNNGTWSNTSAALTISGNLSSNGTFTAGTGVYTFSGVAKTIGGTTNPLAIPSATINGTYTTNSTNLTIATALAGTGTLTLGTNVTVNLGGTTTITNLICTTNTPNKVVYNGAAAQNAKNSATIYYNLEVNKPVGQAVTLIAATSVTNNLDITSGTLADGTIIMTGPTTGTFTMASNGTFTMTNATVNPFPAIFSVYNFNVASTVNYNGNNLLNQNIYNIPAYGNLTTLNGTFPKQAQGNLTVNGNLSVSTTALLDNSFTITVKGNSAISSSHTGTGKILITGGTAAHNLTGTGSYTNLEIADNSFISNANNNFTINGMLIFTNSALAITGGITTTLAGTVTGTGGFSGTSTSNLAIAGTSGGSVGTINFIPGFQNLGLLTMNRTGANASATLGNDLTLNAATGLTLTSGLLHLGSNDLIFASGSSAGAGNAGSFVVADAAVGTGQVMKIFSTTATTFTYPIGDNTGTAEYSPVTITNFIPASIKTIGAIVNDGVHPQMHSNQVQTNYLTRYWTFTEDNAATYTYNQVTLTYINSASDVVGTVSTANDQVNWYRSSQWNQLSSTATPPTIFSVSGTNIYNQTNATLGGSDFTGRFNPPQTYTWIGTSGTGDNGNWTTATHWSPSRFSPLVNDILQYTLGGTPTSTNVPNETIARIIFTGNTDVTLTSVTASTLNISNTTGTNFDVQSGSTVRLSSIAANSITIAFTGTNVSSIAGTLILNANTGFNNTYNATNSTTTVNGTLSSNGTITSPAVGNLTFAAGSFYNHLRNGGLVPSNLAAPFCTWNTTSTCNISGVTSTNPTQLRGTFGNLTWSSNFAGSFTNAATINGDFSITSGSLSDATFLITGPGTASGKTFTITAGESFTMTNTSTVINAGNHMCFPLFQTYALNATSNVNYNGNISNQTVYGTTYGNLTTTNQTKTSAASLTVAGNLTGTSQFILGSGHTLTLDGIISGSFNTTASNVSNIILNGSGTFTFPAATTNGFNNFTLNRNNTVTLAANATVAGTLTLTLGTLAIASNTLTLSGTASSTSGLLSGTSSSNLTINGGATNLGSLGFATGGQLLNNLNLSRGVINTNAGSFTLTTPLSVTQLTIAVGVINNSTNTLTVSGTASNNIAGTLGEHGYVNGRLSRTMVSLTNYLWPVGGAYGVVGEGYNGFEINGSTVSGSTTIAIRYFGVYPGTGTAGAPMSGLTPKYWDASFVSGSISGNPSITLRQNSAFNTNERIAQSSTGLNGVYAYRGGTPNGIQTFITSNSTVVPALGFFSIGTYGHFTGTVTVGTGMDFPSLTNNDGLFQAINLAGISGNVIARISTDISTETGQYALNQFAEYNVPSGGTPGSYNYTMTITPDGSTMRTVTGASYNGTNATTSGLFRFDGSDRVTIDGNDPSTGLGTLLTFRNVSTTQSEYNSTINLLNDATANTISYSLIEGSSKGTGGVLRFSAGTTTGNDNNTVYNCEIKPAGSNLPLRGIVSAGTNTSGIENSEVTISNNKIYNMWADEGLCAGIVLQNGCNARGSTNWTITGNSIYQTAARIAAGELIFRGISINHTSNTNFTIEDNFIGGRAANCGGSAWTQSGGTNTFAGIYLNVNTGGTVSSIKGNTITNISLSSASTADNAAIYINGGSANVGDATAGNGNTIGGGSGITGAFSNTASLGFTGIAVKGTGSPVYTIINNSISGITLSSNGILTGIAATTGTNTIQLNTISTLSANTTSTGTGVSAGITGIEVNTSTSGHSISDNTISALNSTNNSAAVNVVGIYYAGAASGTNIIERNFIHSLSTLTALSSHTGIMLDNGTVTARNNMIRLGINSAGSSITVPVTITGIFDESSATTAGENIYNNSIYIGGTGVTTGSTAHTYGFRRASSGSNTVIIRNNIFQNSRSNISGTTQRHYSIFLDSETGVTSDYNIFYGGSTNGYTTGNDGAMQASLANWQSATPFDDNSYQSDPLYMAPAAATPNLHLDSLQYISIADGNAYPTTQLVTDDFDGDTRQWAMAAHYNEIGADEFCVKMRANPVPANNPPDATVCFPAAVSFTVAAEGSRGHNFLWEYSTDGGTTWNPVPNAAPYSNVTTATLNISSVSAGMIGYKYRSRLRNECSTAYSDVATLISGYLNGTGNTITWTGTTSTNWHVATNWDCRIPLTTDNVIVPGSNTFNRYPVILTGATGDCYTIELQGTTPTNATLDIQGTGIINVTQ